MADDFKQLSEQQQKAVIELATGSSNKEIAQKIGRHPNTILNWKRKPEFAAEVSLLQLAVRDAARRAGTEGL